MKNLYTVDEIAGMIRELGFDAEILPDEPDTDTRISSRTNGIAWQIAMTGDGPFHLGIDRKSTRLNSSHANISYAVFCLKKKHV